MEDGFRDIDEWLMKTREHPEPPADLESKLLAIATRQPRLHSLSQARRPASLWVGLSIGLVGALGLLYLFILSLIHLAAIVSETTWWTAIVTVGVGPLVKALLSGLAGTRDEWVLKSVSVLLWCVLGALAAVAFPMCNRRVRSIR